MTWPRITKALTGTAFYEAGHFVQTCAEGRTVLRATIIPDGSSLGVVEYKGRKPLDRTGLVRPDVVASRGRVSLAGPVAERRLGHRQGTRAYDDCANAIDMASMIPRSPHEEIALL
jgi:hypothetical protein